MKIHLEIDAKDARLHHLCNKVKSHLDDLSKEKTFKLKSNDAVLLELVLPAQLLWIPHEALGISPVYYREVKCLDACDI